MTYAFILGKNPTLSIAEILSVLKRESFVFIILSISGNALIIKTEGLIDNPQDLLDRLGGTIKIVEIFVESYKEDVMGPILGFASSSFSDSKFVFGISSYGTSFPRLGFEVKKKLKEIGINSRFVNGKEKDLSAPEIKNNKILTHGADFILIQNNHKTFVGRTIAIQDYESYSHRDWDRPRKNAKSGMLPPKVAQIMLNLIPAYNLQPIRLPLIYDPFCGQGTILQEALLMGYQGIGSDISKERVSDTRQNLEWFAKEYGIKIESDKIVFQANALSLEEKNLPAKIDTIVSEVYLGPPLTDKTRYGEMSVIIKGLEKEYISFLTNIQHINIPYLVLALPFYRNQKECLFLNIIDEAKKIGYNVIDPFENTGISFDFLPEYDRVRKTIAYSRPDQIVGREIIILEKNN